MSARTWIAIGIIGLFGAGGAAGQVLQPGQAVATCFSGSNPAGDVVGVFDIRNPAANAPGFDQNWNPPRGKSWKLADLGAQVFGLALDDAANPRIYVTATTVYSGIIVTQPPPAPGRTLGEIFQLDPDPVTGFHKVFATLPNSGQGLGNIAYDTKHHQFFVSNFYDGKIYRVSSAGVVDTTNPLDFGAQFLGPAPVPLADRVWGVAVFQDRLYFGTWSPGQVYSVAINPTTGDFSGPIDPQGLLLAATNQPISDIEFSGDGEMLIAERGFSGALTTPHQARVFELSGGIPWQSTGRQFLVGNGANAAGGVDSICETDGGVVATGDALHLAFQDNIYGLQIFGPAVVGNNGNSYLVDLDSDTGALTQQDKTQIGDVDVHNTCDRHCSELTAVKITCATDAHGNPIPGKYTMTFQIKNLSADTVYNAFLVGLTGASTTHFTFPTGLAPGALSPVLTTMISGGTAGQQLTFQVTLHDLELNECCATRHTITLPQCDCAQVLGQKGPYCLFKPFGSYSYSFTLQNLDPNVTPAFVIVVPQSPPNATISPAVSAFTPNTQSVPLTIGNVSGGQQVCFLVSLHTADFERCCSIRQCVTVPKCFDDPWWPIDDTIVTLFEEGLVLEDSGGDPGATLILPEGTTAFDVSWSPEDAANLAVGGTLEQSVTGSLDGGAAETVARLVTTRTATGAELRASFPAAGATRHRFEFYLDGERTGVVEGVGTEVPAICNGCGVKITTDAHFVASDQSGPIPCGGPGVTDSGRPCLFDGFTFNEASRFSLANSALFFQADEVRVFPEDGDTRVDSLTSATVQAHGLPSLTLVDFRTDTDCDGNGIQDFEEIANGTGLDLDRNGLLDLCEVVLIPLAIDLGTGTEGGQALAGGSEDADWTFVSPGPVQAARVVAQPNGGWAPAFPGSRWISVEPETGRSLPGVRFLHFERTFCLTEEARNLVLDLALRADDRASVRLNGQTLAGPGGGFSETLPPLTVQRAGAAGDGLFLVGSNRLEIEVRDPGGIVTGFDLAGSLTGPAGACSEP